MEGLRDSLTKLLEEAGIREAMNTALIREATQGNKSGSVIRAYEMVAEIEEQNREKLEAALEQDGDLSGYTDAELMDLERRLTKELEQAAEEQDPFSGLVSVEEAAAALDVTESSIRKACASLPDGLRRKFGRTWVLTAEAVEELRRGKPGGKPVKGDGDDGSGKGTA